MQRLTKTMLGGFLAALTASSGALAQTPYQDDMPCRQYADQVTTPMREQANAQGVGSALVGAGLGAALGAAIGGGRGAGIGAATGAIAGTGAGVANAQNSAGYIQEQYNAYYYSCMQGRSASYRAPQPGYAQPGYPQGYSQAPGYPPQYAPPPYQTQYPAQYSPYYGYPR